MPLFVVIAGDVLNIEVEGSGLCKVLGDAYLSVRRYVLFAGTWLSIYWLTSKTLLVTSISTLMRRQNIKCVNFEVLS